MIKISTSARSKAFAFQKVCHSKLDIATSVFFCSENVFIFNGSLSMGFLTRYDTIPGFNDLKKKSFENIVGKGENAGNQHFSPFPTMFSTHSKTNFSLSATFILLSSNAFNLNWPKILSFVKELKLGVVLTHYQTTKF